MLFARELTISVIRTVFRGVLSTIAIAWCNWSCEYSIGIWNDQVSCAFFVSWCRPTHENPSLLYYTHVISGTVRSQSWRRTLKQLYMHAKVLCSCQNLCVCMHIFAFVNGIVHLKWDSCPCLSCVCVCRCWSCCQKKSSGLRNGNRTTSFELCVVLTGCVRWCVCACCNLVFTCVCACSMYMDAGVGVHNIYTACTRVYVRGYM